MTMMTVSLCWFALAIVGISAYDSCWKYDYKHTYSSTPYKRTFSCPCGCCGSSWDRWCCSDTPVCNHNSTYPDDPVLDTAAEEEREREKTRQILMLSGIAVGTFLVLFMLTALMHVCGRIYFKSQQKKEAQQQPDVVIYNIQGGPVDKDGGAALGMFSPNMATAIKNNDFAITKC